MNQEEKDETPSFPLEYVVVQPDENEVPGRGFNQSKTSLENTLDRELAAAAHSDSLIPFEIENVESREPTRRFRQSGAAPQRQGRERSRPGLQQLTWRGHRVAPALQQYAERVARGEDLAPYQGSILARDAEPPAPSRASASPIEISENSSNGKPWLFTFALLLLCVGIALAPPQAPHSPERTPSVSLQIAAAQSAPPQAKGLSGENVESWRNQFTDWLLAQFSIEGSLGNNAQVARPMPVSSPPQLLHPTQVSLPKR